MKELPDLKELTEEAKDALIVELWEELQKSKSQAEKKPKKTSWNSSIPTAQGFKANVKSDRTQSNINKLRSQIHLSTTKRSHSTKCQKLRSPLHSPPQSDRT